MTAHGPYATRDDAHADIWHVYEACALERRIGVSDQICLALLTDALKQADVVTGAQDEKIAAWLAGWEPELVQVIIGWIERANTAPADSNPDGHRHLATEGGTK